MAALEVNCKNQTLEWAQDPTEMYSGNIKIDSVTFNFCELWDGYTKTAIFYQDKNKVINVLLDETNACMIPPEVTERKGHVYIGVFGVKGECRRTTAVTSFYLKEGSFAYGQPSEPTPDIYQQIIAKQNELEKAIKNAIGGISNAFVITADFITVDGEPTIKNVSATLKEIKENCLIGQSVILKITYEGHAEVTALMMSISEDEAYFVLAQSVLPHLAEVVIRNDGAFLQVTQFATLNDAEMYVDDVYQHFGNLQHYGDVDIGASEDTFKLEQVIGGGWAIRARSTEQELPSRLVIPYVVEGLTVTEIREDGFAGHDEVTEIILPKSIGFIHGRAFAGTSVTKIVVSEGVVHIGSNAFSESPLEEITIPSSVYSIYSTAFVDTNLKKIYFEGSADQWESISAELQLPDTVKVYFKYTDVYSTIKKVLEDLDASEVEY